MSSSHSQTHDLGKVMGTKVMEAFGPSDIYCSLGLSGANMVMVDSQSHHPQRYPLWGDLSNSQIGRVVGPADSPVDIPAALPSLPNASDSCRSFALWDGTFAGPFIWGLAPDILFPRLLDLAAIEKKLMAVN